MLTLIRAGRLIDGTGAPPVENVTLVVEDGWIRDVMAGEPSLGPTTGEAETIDCSGLTVLPGLIDCHVHLVFSAQPTALQDILTDDDHRMLLRAVHNAQIALRSGVTTVRDCGGRAGVTLSLRDAVRAGVVPGPRIVAAGPAITTTGGHCYFLGGEADTADEIRRLARSLARDGVDFFKVMATGGRMTPGTNVTAAQFSMEELSVLVAEARRLDRTVAAHGHGVAGIRNAVAAGVTTIEHCTWVSESDSGSVAFDPEVAARMARQGTFMTPTLCGAAISARLPEHLRSETWQETSRMLPLIDESRRATIAAGVEVVAGTDAGVANVAFDAMPLEIQEHHRRLGLRPLEAIRAATQTAARALGREHEIGTLEIGRRADILAVDGDPSRDLATLRRVCWVLRDGVVQVQAGRLVRS